LIYGHASFVKKDSLCVERHFTSSQQRGSVRKTPCGKNGTASGGGAALHICACMPAAGQVAAMRRRTENAVYS